MAFETYSKISQSSPVALFEVSKINGENTQWVNHGAGVWALSYSGIYSWVDSSLLTGYGAQDFGDIGIILVDYQPVLKVDTLLEVSGDTNRYYWDNTNQILYISFVNWDTPYMHSVFIGQLNGFSFRPIKPVGSSAYYDPRLAQVPSLGRIRDPLFFGKLSYPSANVTLINADGFLDTYADDNDVYGNSGKIKLGYKDLDIDDYKTLFTGFIETFEVSENDATFGLTNQRKQLSKQHAFRCVNENPITAIKRILDEAYGIKYTSEYFDIDAFDYAFTFAVNEEYQISIYREDDDNIFTVIELIEEICQSVWGIFDVNDDGKYTFKFISKVSTNVGYIFRTDFINQFLQISYNPQDVLSSVMVGYNRDWGDNSHTYYTDTTREADVFARYKTYNQQRFDTLLTSLTGATNLATRIMDYSEYVRGDVTIEVPMRYYGVEVGDTIIVRLDRENSTMLGETFCEILGVTYKLDLPSIELRLRTIGPVNYLVDHNGNYIVTEDGYKIVTP